MIVYQGYQYRGAEKKTLIVAKFYYEGSFELVDETYTHTLNVV